MRKFLCLIMILSPFFSTVTLAQRGPAVSPIVEISAEDNSPVPPSQAVAFDFSNTREVASVGHQSSWAPLIALAIGMPLMIWISVMFRLDRELKKRDQEIENIAHFPKKAPTPAPITGEEDAEDQYKKAS